MLKCNSALIGCNTTLVDAIVFLLEHMCPSNIKRAVGEGFINYLINGIS